MRIRSNILAFLKYIPNHKTREKEATEKLPFVSIRAYNCVFIYKAIGLKVNRQLKGNRRVEEEEGKNRTFSSYVYTRSPWTYGRASHMYVQLHRITLRTIFSEQKQIIIDRLPFNWVFSNANFLRCIYDRLGARNSTLENILMHGSKSASVHTFNGQLLLLLLFIFCHMIFTLAIISQCVDCMPSMLLLIHFTLSLSLSLNTCIMYFISVPTNTFFRGSMV